MKRDKNREVIRREMMKKKAREKDRGLGEKQVRV